MSECVCVCVCVCARARARARARECMRFGMCMLVSIHECVYTGMRMQCVCSCT